MSDRNEQKRLKDHQSKEEGQETTPFTLFCYEFVLFTNAVPDFDSEHLCVLRGALS